jgi:FAD:protein FMN transferase
LGNAPDDKPWRFGIESAANVKTQGPAIVADGRGMATSSDAHTTFTPDHLHHHIFNPHTGDSPRYWSSATVIAPSCAMADALTKVFFMCPPQLIHSTARAWGVDVIMQDKNGNWLNTLPSALS